MNRRGNDEAYAIVILALVLAAFIYSVSGVVSKAATTTLVLPRGELYPHDKKEKDK